MPILYLGLGANLGEREHNLAQGVRRLAAVEGVSVHRRSSLYQSAPVGPQQPDYLNAVLEVECELPPLELLVACKRIEKDLGRVAGPRWGPRPLDIDLLLGEEIVAEPGLQVPHLELHKRAFALMPLCELAPQAMHPLLHRTVRSLLNDLEDQGVRRVGEFFVDL